MLDYTLLINGLDIAPMIERDSYQTSRIPVYSDTVVTMDGIEHTALLRNKGEISFEFNPQNASDTAYVCAVLLETPCEVYYYDLQMQTYVLTNMRIDSQSAQYLSRCLYRGEKWNQIDPITLTEL